MTEIIELFSTDDLKRLQTSTFVEHIHYAHKMQSTSDVALQLASDSQLPTPALILTDVQTAGRGRGANQWWAARGALTFSLILPSQSDSLTLEKRPQISLLAGLAVCHAIEEHMPEIDAAIKWPNDVFIQGRKVAGILAEMPADSRGRVVIGIGVNVNNSLTDAPAELGSIATSIGDTSKNEHCLRDTLTSILVAFERLLGETIAGEIDLAASWQTRCFLTGKQVRIEAGNKR